MFAALEAAKGGLTLQVIVVDNASRDGSVEILRTQFPNVELIENSVNVGFGRQTIRHYHLLRALSAIAQHRCYRITRYPAKDRGIYGVPSAAVECWGRACRSLTARCNRPAATFRRLGMFS